MRSLVSVFRVVLLCVSYSAVCIHATPVSRWTRATIPAEECIYPEESTMICPADTTPCNALSIDRKEYRIITPPGIVLNVSSSTTNYDVWAYRACGNDNASELTWSGVQNAATLCERGDTITKFTIRFKGCGEYFSQTGGEKGLELYHFANASCSLQYRFLFVNTTSECNSNKLLVSKLILYKGLQT